MITGFKNKNIWGVNLFAVLPQKKYAGLFEEFSENIFHP
jgi:hypothetical protein